MEQEWMQAFGAGLHIGVNAPTVVAGNGLGNEIGGNVNAVGEQSISDGPGLSIGVNVPTVVAGNGVDNCIGGDVNAHRPPGHRPVGVHTSIPFFGSLDVGVNVSTLVAGNGVGNHIGGDVSAAGFQDFDGLF